MKRRDFLAASAVAPIALAASARLGMADESPSRHSARMARPGQRMSAAEFAAFREAPDDEFKVASLSAPEQRQARDLSAMVNALVIKGALHRIDPKAYPVSRDPKSMEAMAATLANQMDARTFARLRPRLRAALRQPAQTSKILGPLSAIDFRKPELQAAFAPLSVRRLTPPPPPVPPPPGSSYNRLHLQVRALHCVDETNPEGGSGTTDDMVLGGIAIGATGNTGTCNSIVCGEFNDGTYWNYGSYLFFNYRLPSNLPKTFYCVFQLVESDSDDAEVAQGLTSALGNIAQIAAGAAGGPSAAAVAGAVVQSISTLLGLFLDEDYMNPYSLALTLNNQNAFGGADSNNLATPNIGGHGGAYRIGYRWHLAG